MTTRTELVCTLAKPGESILLSLDAHKCHMLHMAVGLAGGAGEILEATDSSNMLEELGDAKFYTEGLLQGLGSSIAQFTTENQLKSYAFLDIKDHMVAVAINCANIMDDVKRYVIYNKPLDQDSLTKNISTVLCLLEGLAMLWGFTDEEIHADNLRKLGKRYASLTYSDAAAQARADKQ